MQARVGIGVVRPGMMRELTERLSETLYPEYQNATGFAGALLLKNSDEGNVLSIILWETDADLVAGESRTVAQRASLAPLFAAQRLIETYEVSAIRTPCAPSVLDARPD